MECGWPVAALGKGAAAMRSARTRLCAHSRGTHIATGEAAGLQRASSVVVTRQAYALRSAPSCASCGSAPSAAAASSLPKMDAMAVVSALSRHMVRIEKRPADVRARITSRARAASDGKKAVSTARKMALKSSDLRPQQGSRWQEGGPSSDHSGRSVWVATGRRRRGGGRAAAGQRGRAARHGRAAGRWRTAGCS